MIDYKKASDRLSKKVPEITRTDYILAAILVAAFILSWLTNPSPTFIQAVAQY